MATVSKYTNTSGGTLWRVRYRTPDKRQTDKRGFRIKREAEVFATSVEHDKQTGSYVAPSAGRVTIGDLGPAWLARQRGHCKPTTSAAYRGAWQTHVEPRWGNAAIGAIRYSDISAWIADLGAAGKSAETTRRAYRVLASILGDAVRDRLLPSSPATGVKMPARPQRKHIYLTRDQLDRLADESGRYCSLVLLLGLSGLRWGEAAALRVGDIDLRGRVSITRNAATIGGRTVVGTLKTGRSRTVTLPDFVAEALSRTCRGKGLGELIWKTAKGDCPKPPGAESWLDGAVRRCQLSDPTFPRVTAHHLRHTAVSLAVHAGANVMVVQRMLGHASAAMTLDVYADLFDSDLDAVAVKLGQMWANGSG
jgi:integrase